MVLIQAHGARIQVPEAWEDASIYRFLPPVEREDEGILLAKKPRRAQPNVVVTRHAQVEGDPPEKLLEVMNEKAVAENKTYRVIAGGAADYLEQPARWQDVHQSVRDAGLDVFQRHVVIPGWEGELVLVTITGDRSEVASMSEAMGLVTSGRSG